eukprot:3951003-Prorocentrum_lima.AAC.1
MNSRVGLCQQQLKLARENLNKERGKGRHIARPGRKIQPSVFGRWTHLLLYRQSGGHMEV